VSEREGPGGQLLREITALSKRRELPLAQLSIEEIADGLGMSRSTLYRRIGSRQALDEALRQSGIDTGDRPSATERMLDAAASIIRESGPSALTMEAVADRADVALQTVFARFRNRTGLLTAVFERHSPVPRIQRHLRPVGPGNVDAFRRTVTEVYGEIWDLLTTEHALISGMVIEVLREPNGEVRAFVERSYLPQVFHRILPWLGDAVGMGMVRPMPPLLLGQAFVAPMVMHVATRPIVSSTGIAPLPDRDEACARFADLFCAAVLQAGIAAKPRGETHESN